MSKWLPNLGVFCNTLYISRKEAKGSNTVDQKEEGKGSNKEKTINMRVGNWLVNTQFYII